jgi:hypothetical protein
MTATITPRIAQNALRILYAGSGSQIPDVSLLAVLDQRELAARFRARALQLHPDRAQALGVSPVELDAQFKRLHGAYRVLGRLVEDPRLRESVLSAARQSAPVPSESGLWTPRPAGGPSGSPFFIDPADLPQADLGEEERSRRFFSGRVPASELRFAQFLYYHRVIDWKTMIDAVTWQYRVRPKVGEIGRSYQFLDFKSVNTVLKESPRGELFGRTALKLGILDPRQLRVMLGKQHQLNYPIGRFFTEHGILNKAEVEKLLGLNKRHNRHYRDDKD